MLFWKVFWLNESFVLLQLALAWVGLMATTEQMNRLGYRTGVPALAHGGWWADLLIVGWIMGTIVEHYAHQWRPAAIVSLMAISAIATTAANINYLAMSKAVPNFTAIAGHVTAAGWVHMFYSFVVFGVSLLFWFESQRVVDYKYVVLIGLGTLIHILAGFAQPAHYVGESLTKPGLLCSISVVLLLLAAGFVRLTLIALR